MLLTIFGETLNCMNFVNVSKENEINSKLHAMCKEIEASIAQNDILYTSRLKNKRKIKSPTFNLINYSFNDKIQENLRKILITESFFLESNYPGSGDLYLKLFLKYQKNKYKFKSLDDYIASCLSQIKKVKRKSKKDIYEKLNEFESLTTKKICEKVIDMSSHDTNIFLENTSQKNIFLKKTDKVNFSLAFDERFLISNIWKADRFKFIVIDGFIQEVSEIHHLLTKASEDKEKYVIFCKGASEEVKNTILYNLQRGTIDVFPICLKINEENVNVLNDIASCLGSDIVSAIKGDTISASVRRTLPEGKNIHISSSGFSIDVIDKKKLDRQKLYLKLKLQNINSSDPNFRYITSRIKNLESNKLVIKINRNEMNEQYEDVDKFLKFLQLGKRGIVNVSFEEEETKIYSLRELVILFEKLKSTIIKISDLGCAITME